METNSVNLMSVLKPYQIVCKQSDVVQKCVGKLSYRNARIYDIKVLRKERKKLFKKLVERGQQMGHQGEYLQQLVPQYIARLRDPQEEVRLPDNNPDPLQVFQKMAEDVLQTDPAQYSFVTTEKDDCFVGLVTKKLEESGNIVEMMLYFLQDGVKQSNAGGAVQEGEEEGAVGGAVGGAPEEEQGPTATLVLPQEWRGSFKKSLENMIHLCHRHIHPALEALRTGCNSYTDVNGKLCKFTASGHDRKLRQGLQKFRSKVNYRLGGKNIHGGSQLLKVHLNGDGSDCLLVYVEQNYKQKGRVFLLVGVYTHYECGIKTGAKKKEHGTQKASERGTLDITDDLKAAEEYLEHE